MLRYLMLVGVFVGLLIGLAGALPAGAGEIPICTTPDYQFFPVVAGNIVAWSDSRNGFSDIYGKNLATGQEFSICAAANDQESPAISDNIIVWHDNRNDNNDIYGKNLTTDEEFAVCITADEQNYPAISGSIVVWADNRNGNWDIYGKNLTSGEEFPICIAAGDQGSPAISGDVVVWEDYRSDDLGDIYGVDLTGGPEFAISTGINPQYAPAISGDIVVWEQWEDGGDSSIYAKNLTTSDELLVCSATSYDYYPVISGDIVVWGDSRNGDSDIYGYNLTTGEEFTVCTAPGDQGSSWWGQSLAFSGNIIAWTDDRNNPGEDYDLYGLSLNATAPTVTTTVPTIDAVDVSASADIALAFSAAMYQPDTQAAFSISPQVAGSFAWNFDSTELTFTPETPLAADTTYTVTLGAGATDIAGNPLAVPYSWSFAVVNDQAAPAAPSDLVATALSGTKISLAWQDNSSNETGFRIECKIDADGSWGQLADLPADTTEYQNDGLTPGTTYYYRLMASNLYGDSDYSNEASATTLLPPAAPSNLTATAMRSTQIDLSWQDNASNETGFRVEFKSGAAGSWSQLTDLPADSTEFQNSGLTPNTTYHYRVLAYSNDAYSNETCSDYSNEESATTPLPPAAPSLLTATAVSAHQVNLSWRDNAANETGYRVERKLSTESDWSQIADLAAGTRIYSDSSVEPNQSYNYRVYAYNELENSAYSNTANITTPLDIPAPGDLTATPTAGRINLSWQDDSTNEAGFRIERKAGNGGAWSQIGTVAANVTAYPDTTAAVGPIYYYRVRAYNGGSSSDYSNEASAGIYAMPVTPSYLRGRALSAEQVSLSWRDSSTSETGFLIERRQGVYGIWQQVGEAPANSTSYTDTGVAPRTGYYYRVCAYSGALVSGYSNVVTLTTPIYVGAPGQLTATALSANRIMLNWQDNAANESGYKVERKRAGAASWSIIASPGGNKTVYIDTGLAADTTYLYRVRAYRSSAYSAYSEEASTTTLPLPPSTPSRLAARVISAHQVDLTWRDISVNEMGFLLERKAGSSGAWLPLETLCQNTTGYSDTCVDPRTTYAYRICALGELNNSGYSNVVTATTPIYLAAPSGLTAYSIGASQIRLRWQDNSDNEAGFKVDRWDQMRGVWTPVGTVAAGTTQFVYYTNSGLASHMTYYYRVRAYSGSIFSAFSNEAGATTQ